MSTDMDYNQDDKTVLLDRNGNRPGTTPLTNSPAPPRIEQLENRMIYASHQRSAEALRMGLNPLVAAASDLFAEVVRIKQGNATESLDRLNQDLSLKLNSFEAYASHNGVERGQISTARYLICTVLDEAVVMKDQGRESEWSQMSLLSRFHNETFGGEKFFQLLDRLSKDPASNLQILELMYVCLALGFQGKYGLRNSNLFELESIRDAVYRQIRQLRGDAPRELSPHWEGLVERRRRLVRVLPLWMLVLFSAACLALMYSSFAWVLGNHRNAILQPYQSVDSPAVQTQSQP